MNLKGIKFEIQDGNITSEQKSYEGKSYESHTQTGWMHTDKPFPTEFRINHDKASDTPIAPGFYELAPDAISVRNNRLQIQAKKLVPVAAEASNVRPAQNRQSA